MPIDTKHSEYTAYEKTWQKCIDFTSGEDEVKSQGTKYLPKLSEQNAREYTAYKHRTLFYNATGRTVAALVSAIFAKEPSIQLPEKLEYLKEDATGTGITMTELLIKLITREMITGRVGLLADRVDDGDPYLVIYDELQITNWKTDGDDNYVVLAERYEEADPQDKFKLINRTRFRELAFEEGQYVVRIWESKSAKSKKYEVVETIVPTKNGQPLEFVPFAAISPAGLDFEIDKPPMLDMVNVQAVHYMVSADWNSALHTICIPTPYVTGLEATDDEGASVTIKLGAGSAILPPDVASKVGFLEFEGKGLESVEDALTKMENMLAALGAKLVETQKNNADETAEGVRTREAAATAVLNSVISSAETAATRVLKRIAEWENADPKEVDLKLNRELVQTPMDANMLIALTKAMQEGSMSFETFFHNLKESGFYGADATVANEKTRIKENPQVVAPEPVKPEKDVDSGNEEENND